MEQFVPIGGEDALAPLAGPALRLVRNGRHLRVQKWRGQRWVAHMLLGHKEVLPEEWGDVRLHVTSEGWAFFVTAVGDRYWADPIFSRALYSAGPGESLEELRVVLRPSREETPYKMYFSIGHSVFVDIAVGTCREQKTMEVAVFPNSRAGVHVWWSLPNATAAVGIAHSGKFADTTKTVRQSVGRWEESCFNAVGLHPSGVRRSQQGGPAADTERCLDLLCASTCAFLRIVTRWSGVSIQSGGLAAGNNVKAQVLLSAVLERCEQMQVA